MNALRLNPDCVRDVLLCVEEHTSLRKCAVFIDLDLHSQTADILGLDDPEIPSFQKELMEQYDCDELIYHINYCAEAELIKLSDMTAGDAIWVADLTPKGHEFLANIREHNNWQKTKEISSKVGSAGISMLGKIAEGVASAWMKQQLGLL
ncbi:DUF2513 domain-containing protein [uncultured Dysosmobacter sp.]|uniref:DUF2513 domain-containing protein n=1 Tax=uncultured Dysosmobacter sp. TaxID=2591384 RepID=UPI00262063C9|nr:DUF2513 domain-containing protein [uncultured Dysosmobacter sp.]